MDALWILFSAGLLLLLTIDLALPGRRAHVVSLSEAAAWSAVWVGASLAFNLWIWIRRGPEPALQFFAGYLIEKSLSVDNLFVFVLLFRYFAVDPLYQHRVLNWGVTGSLVLRGAMIAAGVTLVKYFDWVLYLFGAFLVYAALKMLFRKEQEFHAERNFLVRAARRLLPMSGGDAGPRFFLRKNGRGVVTSLFVAVIAIEVADLIFALDSVPAVLGITRDPFIVFSSNACAVLGLRALYFLLAGWMARLRHLGTGVSLVLLFLGAKMLAAHWLQISTLVSLAVIAGILAVAVVVSNSSAPATASKEDP